MQTIAELPADSAGAPIPSGLLRQRRQRERTLQRLARLRQKASAEIERLIAFLDASDPYAATELEQAIDDGPIDEDELEPSLCGIVADGHIFGMAGTYQHDLDREQAEGDDEPSLGWTDEEAARGRYADRRDLEEQCDDEGEAAGGFLHVGGAA